MNGSAGFWAVMACAFTAVVAPAVADDCGKAAAVLLAAAGTAGVDRLSVLELTPKAGAAAGEAEYVAEELTVHLSGAASPVVVERSQLGKLLKEARLGAALDGAPPGRLLSVDAVVTGSVFANGDELRVLLRLVDLRSGVVIKAAACNAERGWPDLPGDLVPDIDSLPEPRFSAPPPGMPADFRDAPADRPGGTCAARKRRLGELNAELVDAKARYWAGRMREPGFSVRDLSRNPGSEISDPSMKEKFYRLLGVYHADQDAGPPDAAALPRLLELLRDEKKLRDECGSL